MSNHSDSDKMTNLIVGAILLVGVACIVWVNSVHSPTPEEKIRALLPNTTIDQIKPSAWHNVYEVIAGDNVFYVQPGKPMIMVGHLFNLATAEDMTQISKDAASIKTQPVSESVTEDAQQ